MIIALGTRKQVGKDTVGNYLVEKHGFKRLAFADALKEEVKNMLSIMSIPVTYDPKDEKNKERFRPLLIAYSEICRSVDPNWWLNPIIKAIFDNPKQNWVITDMRYPNEASTLRTLGAFIIKLERNTGLPDEPTEAVGDKIEADYVIENNDSIEELHKKIDNLVKMVSE